MLREALDRVGTLFEKDGVLRVLYPVYEMVDTFLYTPSYKTRGSVHLRDGIDLKRVMVTVSVALIPCIFMACLGTGLQANLAIEETGGGSIAGWRGTVLSAMGLVVDSADPWSNFVHGLLYFLPVFAVTQAAGGLCEVIFSVVRKHEVNEGFLVTGILFPLTLPPTIPLWQVALGAVFGVVMGKEIFGGTGRNFLNPALTGRAFLYFAYPGDNSGDAVWVAVDGYTRATPLGIGASSGLEAIVESYSWWDCFMGFMPGSFGESSAAACLFGALVLVATGIGSWRIMVSVLAGAVGVSLLFNFVGSATNPMFSVTPWWHLVLGGFAFGTVFMATDPVSGAMTFKGQYAYGLLIGIVAILVRVVNPAFPEGMMLAVLFANCFAPLIDYVVVRANIKRRRLRTAMMGGGS